MKNDETTARPGGRSPSLALPGSWAGTWSSTRSTAATKSSGCAASRSVAKLDRFKGRITVVPAPTDDREAIGRAVAGCDAVLTVLAPMGVRQYRVTNGAGGPRPCERRAPGFLVRMAHHPRRSGHLHWRLLPTVVKVARGGLPESLATATCATGSSRADASSRAIDSGRWSAAATLRKARAWACRCGAATWATRS